MSKPALRHLWILLGAIIATSFYAVVQTVAARSASGPVPLRSGEELVAIFVASSTCRGIRDPRLKQGLDQAFEQLARYADNTGRVFVKVAVMIDEDLGAGEKLVREFGPFDEIHLGRNYLNTAAVRYLSQLPGRAAIPQLVVAERRVTVRGGIMTLDHEEVIVRKVGPVPILRWAQALASYPAADN